MKSFQNAPNINITRPHLRSVSYKIKSLKQTNSQIDIQNINGSYQLKHYNKHTNHQIPPINKGATYRGFSINSNLRVKRVPLIYDQQVYQTQGYWGSVKEIQEIKEVETVTYLQTFKSMMATKKISKIDNEEWKVKSRINLPSVEQNQSSKFTLLDPIRLPIQYIADSIKQQTENLKKNNEQINLISEELKNIQRKIKKQLQIIQIQTKEKLSAIRAALKKNAVNNQQFKTESKRLCNQLIFEFEHDVKTPFDNILNTTQNLQEEIFNTLPFELVNNPQFQQFQQKLF